MKTVIVIALIIGLEGCATNQEPDWHWYKPRATQQDFLMDDGQCKAQGFGIPGGNLLQVVLVHQSCMQGKGWIKVVDK